MVSVSSRGHKFSDIRWDDLQWSQGYDKWQAYGQAKTANVLFAVALDARGQQAGVRTFAVYPAGVRTPLAPLFKTPEQGAADEAWASAQLTGIDAVAPA